MAVFGANRYLFNCKCHYILTIKSPCRYASTEVEAPAKRFPKVSSSLQDLRKGTGGRSSFSGKVATVFGATGFLGRSVVNQLGKVGTQVIIPYRCDAYDTRPLKLCGDLGQILFTEFSLKDEESLYKAMKYSNIVINCIGKEIETPNFSFEDVHVKGPQNIARIAKECGVETLVHVSALNACEKPTPIVLKKGSKFYSSKWRGEQAIREIFPNAIVIRPSDMWGPVDRFLSYYMYPARRTLRSLSLWNRGRGIIKQPIYVGDVAKGVVKAASDPDAAGHTFQAVGPHRYELAELIDWFHRVTHRTPDTYCFRMELRYDLYYWLKLLYSEIVFTRDRKLSWERLERECTTDVYLPDHPTLEDLGVKLTLLEDRIFYELELFRAHAYVDILQEEYIRPVEPAPLARG